MLQQEQSFSPSPEIASSPEVINVELIAKLGARVVDLRDRYDKEFEAA